MNNNPILIKGGQHIDARGVISFVNGFDMSLVKRFYIIQPKLNLPRAWQGHKLESKWFSVIKGRFRVKLRSLETLDLVGNYELEANQPSVLVIPKGFYNGFESLEEGGLLMVFSDATLNHSQSDDYRATLEEIPWE